MIRVLVADDHPAYRRGLALMLTGVDDLELVGSADTGAVAVEMAGALAPDVVLMDLRMPDLDGIEATRRIKRLAAAPVPAVVVLTMFDDDESVFTAMRAGARGYLLKGADQDEIVRAIRAAAAGEAIFGPEVAARVVDHFAAGAGSTTAAFPALTDREREVLAMIAAGKGNATIAHELMISLKTVRNHVSNIFTKLQVSDRSSAIVKARRARHGRRQTVLVAGRRRTYPYGACRDRLDDSRRIDACVDQLYGMSAPGSRVACGSEGGPRSSVYGAAFESSPELRDVSRQKGSLRLVSTSRYYLSGTPLGIHRRGCWITGRAACGLCDASQGDHHAGCPQSIGGDARRRRCRFGEGDEPTTDPRCYGPLADGRRGRSRFVHRDGRKSLAPRPCHSPLKSVLWAGRRR